MSSRDVPGKATWFLAIFVWCIPFRVHAQTISDSVQYALDVMEPWTFGSLTQQAKPDKHEALQMLNSRVVVKDKPLDEYRCDDGPIDNGGVLRAGRYTRKADRLCRRYQFRNRNMDGVKQWGPPALPERRIIELADRAEQKTHVPAYLIVLIARFSSGYLPGLVTEDGRYGLLQLKPELLKQMQIKPGPLLDPRTNINQGAEYLRRLFFRFRSIKIALAAYRDGPNRVALSADVPRDRANLWFTREILTLYRLSIQPFPARLGTDAMTYVWQEIE